jgi:hypothetical protein
MKFLIAIFLVSFSVSAQEIKLENDLQIPSITIENNSIITLEDVNIAILMKDKSSIALKKSYKNIIEKTLSGEKFLIFKAKREVKIC